MVEPMANILCKHSFCDFVKIQQKFLPFPSPNQHTFSLQRRRYRYCGLNFKQVKYKNLTSKHWAVKNLQIAKTFSKNVNKEVTKFFKIWVISFFTVVLCLFTCIYQCTNFSVKNLFSKCGEKTADLLKFVKLILNKKLHFLCRECYWFYYWVLQVFLQT